MCGIAGVVSGDEKSAGFFLKPMLESMQHRGPDGAGAVIGGVVQRKKNLAELSFENQKGPVALGHVRLAITGGEAGVQPFQSRDGRLSLLHNGEIYNYRELQRELDDRYAAQTGSDSEVILRLLEKHYQGDLVAVMQKVLPRLDGVYALAVTDNRETVIARDRLGVRQLYVGGSSGCTFFASERKPLWRLLGREAQIERLLPGHMMQMGPGSVRNLRFWDPESIRTERQIESRQEALQAYGQAIEAAVRKRVSGRERVGIIFSGGIDSLLVAYLVRKFGLPFTCYTAGRRGAPDLEWAHQLARRFDLPLKARRLTTGEIRDLIPEIMTDIEDHSFNQVEVAVPIYAAVRMAQEEGERVLLSGQGADELFGGYPWYARIVDREGYEAFQMRSWEDTLLLYKECLEREDKIAMAHSIEVRVPFLDPAVVRTAFEISPRLKIERGNDEVCKRVHREYCVSIGIPRGIAFRRKEAAQHGADVHAAFEELAQADGVDAKRLDEVGYDPDLSLEEKLGSSSRYGLRYGDRHLWEPLPEVQYYLDGRAASLGLLAPESLNLWREAARKLQAR